MRTKIGTFIETQTGGFSGSVFSLTQNNDLEIVPNLNKNSEDAPDYKVNLRAGGHEVGAGWKKTADSGKSYVSFGFDDFALPAKLYAVLALGLMGVKSSPDDSEEEEEHGQLALF